MTRVVAAWRGAEVTLVAAAVAATVPAHRGLFATSGYLIPLLIMAGAGILPAVLAAVMRWWTSVTVVWAAAVFLFAAGRVLMPETLSQGLPSGGTLSALRSGLVDGWADTLTVVLPADVVPHLLITPGFLVYVAGFAATTAALRTRALLAPLPFLLLPLVATLLLTAERPRGLLPESTVVLSASLLLVLLRTAGLDGAVGGTRLAAQVRFGLPIVLLVVLGAVGATRLAPIGDRARFDPRHLLRSHSRVVDTVTPLALVRGQLQEMPRRSLFTVEQLSGPPLDRVRTAALDAYDGSFWTSDDRFLRAGHRLASASGRAASARVELRVDIAGLDQPYLPAAGFPERITADGQVQFCAVSGVLTSVADRPSKLHYDLVAVVPALPTPQRPVAAARPAGRDPRTPPLPVTLMRAARALSDQALTPYAKLEALNQGLRNMPYALNSRPGHSLRRLGELFTQDGGGYAEQYAAAFAVIARSLGYPARVATGYLLRPESLSRGVYTVRTSDAWAWAEVNMSGYGWMTFDPSDPRNHRPRRAQSLPRVPVAPTHVVGRAPTGKQATAEPARQPGPGLPAASDWLPPVLAALLILTALLPAAVVAEKWRRCRRRRRGRPAQRITGAWRQSTDRLREAGLPIRHCWTALETAEQAHAWFGAAAAPIGVLAPLVDRACYSNRLPDPAIADDAWQADRALRTALRRERGLVATVRARLNPAPLLSRSS